jgi:hypothetical protein
MMKITLIALGVLALSLIIAGALCARRKTWLGVFLGLLPIAVMEVGFWLALGASIQQCIDRACATAGLPPGCEIAQFGCTEWSGLSYFIFIVVGVVDAFLYLLGVIAIVVIYARRRAANGGRGESSAA